MTQKRHRIAFLAKPSEMPKPRKRTRKRRQVSFLHNTRMATDIGLMVYPVVRDIIEGAPKKEGK